MALRKSKYISSKDVSVPLLHLFEILEPTTQQTPLTTRSRPNSAIRPNPVTFTYSTRSSRPRSAPNKRFLNPTLNSVRHVRYILIHKFLLLYYSYNTHI